MGEMGFRLEIRTGPNQFAPSGSGVCIYNCDVAGNPKCETCLQRWREYTAATFEHIEVNTRLKLAAGSFDEAAIELLRLQVEIAAKRRAAAHDALRKHEYEAHRNAGAMGQPAPRAPRP